MASATSPPLLTLRYGLVSLVTLTFTYGLYFAMTIMTWCYLRARGTDQSGRRFILLYTIAMFLSTFGNSVSTAMVLESIIVEAPADTPEASGALLCGAWSITSLVTETLQFLLSDGLMVYRTFMLFSTQRMLMVIPIMLWIGFAGISIAIFVTSCGLQVVDGAPVNTLLYYNMTTLWYSATTALQVITTSMIIVKLIQHRRALGKHLALTSGGVGYVSLMNILAESALLYTASTITFIPMFRSDSPIQIWWGQVVGSLAFLNPAFIILRVVMGQSYVSATYGPASSTLQFSTRNTVAHYWRSNPTEQDSSISSTKPMTSHEKDLEMSVRCDVVQHTT